MDIKHWYMTNKYKIMLALLIVLASFIVGCTTGGGSPSPTGPIGGGCGG